MSRRRGIYIAFSILGILHLAALLAGWLAPYDPSAQDREYPFAPPTRLHFIDSQGRFHLRPRVYRLVRRSETSADYEEDTREAYPLLFFTRTRGQGATSHEPEAHPVTHEEEQLQPRNAQISPMDPLKMVSTLESGQSMKSLAGFSRPMFYFRSRGAAGPSRWLGLTVSGAGSEPAARRRLFGVQDPGRIFLLGTDEYGRDQLSRLLYGSRISLFSGLAAAAMSLVLGLIFGALAGFYGKLLDETIMRAAELFLALPWLYCLLAFRAFLPLHVSPARTFLLLVLVIGAVGWARPARLVRGVVLSARERDYVLAARGFGASGMRLLVRHVLPETYGLVLTQAALLIPQYILAEVTLSFLGLGIGEPASSWGTMLSSLQRYHVLVSYWWMCIPGIALIIAVLAYYALANALHKQVEY